MKKAFFVLFLMLLGPVLQAEEPGDWAKEVVFPLGDARAGREVFQAYDCHVCHRVAHDKMLPELYGSVRGPDFDMNVKPPPSLLDLERAGFRKELSLPDSDYRAEQFAMEIMSPEHSIAAGYSKGSVEDEPETSMPSLVDTMTTKELRDLVAYLVDAES